MSIAHQFGIAEATASPVIEFTPPAVLAARSRLKELCRIRDRGRDRNWEAVRIDPDALCDLINRHEFWLSEWRNGR